MPSRALHAYMHASTVSLLFHRLYFAVCQLESTFIGLTVPGCLVLGLGHISFRTLSLPILTTTIANDLIDEGENNDTQRGLYGDEHRN